MEYIFDKEKCWYKEVCQFYETNECYAGCIRYLEMFHLMKHSNIPIKYSYPIKLAVPKVDKESFKAIGELKNNIVAFVNAGYSLYLYSQKSGNGKTTWSIKLMQKYFDEIWSGNGFNCRGLFINVPIFLNQIKDSIGGDKTEIELIKEKIKNTDLVIWDDVVVSDMKEFDYNTLLSLIEIRYNSLKANIYTGNMNEEELKKIVGERLFSRIFTASKYKIELKGSDMRGNL